MEVIKENSHSYLGINFCLATAPEDEQAEDWCSLLRDGECEKQEPQQQGETSGRTNRKKGKETKITEYKLRLTP